MIRSLLIVAMLLLVPIAVYWPTVSHEYGFRDDYAHLREAREFPEGLERFASSDGRPVYGQLLVSSVVHIDRVAELSALRLLSTLLLSFVALLLWRQLRRSGWADDEAAIIAVAMTLLPGAQVLASWAIAWPIALGLVMALTGFMLVEQGLARWNLRGLPFVFAGSVLYFIAGLTYQTTVLFAVMPLAALLLMRNRGGVRDDMLWVGMHIGILFLCLFGGWLLMNAVFSNGAVAAADRMHLEPHPLLKLLWFARNPLPNSIALFALRDRFATPPTFFIAIAAVIVAIVAGFFYGARGKWQKQRWLFVALALPFVAHSVSLAANSQVISYRTLLPLSGLFIVLAMFGLRAALTQLNLHRAVRLGLYGGVLTAAALLARHNAFTLIAEPQGREWQLVKATAARLKRGTNTQVFIILPRIEDRSTERVYADEFGSLSSDAEWAAEEMFKRAMIERFPSGLPPDLRYTLDTGFAPSATTTDLELDLRVLKREGNRKTTTGAGVQG